MNSLPYVSCSTLGYGVYTRLAPLPKGWAWIQHERDWLLARDEFGRFFYANFPADGAILMVLRDRATLWDWLVTGGKLKPGTFFADYRFTIFFPRIR